MHLNRNGKMLEETIDFGCGFRVEFPGERLAATVCGEQAAFNQDIFLDGQKAVEPRL